MAAHLQHLFIQPPPEEWLRFAGILIFIGLVIGLGEFIRWYLRWSPEFTRKLVHISIGILIFFAPKLFERAMMPMIFAILAIIGAYAAIQMGLLRSLHAVSRGAYGTVYFPLAFLILIVLFWNSHPEIVSLSMLALGLGDSMAAIVGESIKNPLEYHLTSDKKSIQGSAAMFLATVIGMFFGMIYLFNGTVFSSTTMVTALICSAMVATSWEALSSRGLDNLTVPLSVSFVLFYVLVPSPMRDLERFVTGLGLGLAIAVLSYYARFLKASGSVATFLLAGLVYGIGGWKWTMPILVFFVLSSLLSKAGKKKKQNLGSIIEKGGTRDVGQVAANGGIAGLLVLLQYCLQEVNLYPVYLGAVAAVTADTWGTEIGTFVQGRTVSIASFRFVAPGTNGGVSLAGFFGGVAGSSVIALSSLPWQSVERVIGLVAISGVAGSIVDSVLGATLQSGYRCPVCGKATEKRIHCECPTEFVGGLRWMNNDLVNTCCSISGAVISILLLQI
jgi:uncharacterized protein (TIGR00297 family)